MRKIREMLRLREECGLSLRQTARAVQVSRPVITEYLARCQDRGLRFEDVRDMPDDTLAALLENPSSAAVEDERYRSLLARFDYFIRELKRVGVTRRVLWEEYRQGNPDGYGYSQFCHHLQAWEGMLELSMHIEHKAGDKLFIDFAGNKLSFVEPVTGEVRQVEVFVAVLGASLMTYVAAVMSQRKHDFITVNVNALHYLGGVPAAIVPDCLKSGVTRYHRYEPDINAEYLDFTRHYDTTILPARPARPRDKALVEGAVKLVYQRIYAPLRDRVFHSLDEINAAIREELERFNNRPMRGYGKSRRQLFEEIEKDALKPLPAERYQIREFARVKVQFNYHVYLAADRHYYSVPYRFRGRRVEVICGDFSVEIHYNNERISIHERDRRPGRYSTHPEHMPPQHRWMDDWNPDKLITWAETIGAEVRTVIETVLSSRQHPEQSYRTCLGILNLNSKYGDKRLLNACRIAVSHGRYSFKAIQAILDRNMDGGDEQPGLFDGPLPLHENIRGGDYYAKEDV